MTDAVKGVPASPFDQNAFRAALEGAGIDVSRETLERLEVYRALLVKWQKAVNLVAGSTLEDAWRRHFLDSAQLVPRVAEGATDTPDCIDLGTGAGFPGLVLAIMGVGRWTLVDSDHKKTVFLSEVARHTDISVTIRPMRIEVLSDMKADVITARACAPLTDLLTYARPLLRSGGRCLFLKGGQAEVEIGGAASQFTFTHRLHTSLSDPSGRIVEIGGLQIA